MLGQTELMDFDAIADELYGLPLNEFISVRIEREQQAKSANDKDLAAEIHRMAKPNTVAWLANQLVRRHRDEIQTLLEVGSEMRDATATLSGNRLRELSRQQHQLIRSLVQQAERLTNSAGKQLDGGVARGLEETFHAALVDQAAADVLAAGRLTAGLSSTGFGNFGWQWYSEPQLGREVQIRGRGPVATEGETTQACEF